MTGDRGKRPGSRLLLGSRSSQGPSCRCAGALLAEFALDLLGVDSPPVRLGAKVIAMAAALPAASTSSNAPSSPVLPATSRKTPGLDAGHHHLEHLARVGVDVAAVLDQVPLDLGPLLPDHRPLPGIGCLVLLPHLVLEPHPLRPVVGYAFFGGTRRSARRFERRSPPGGTVRCCRSSPLPSSGWQRSARTAVPFRCNPRASCRAAPATHHPPSR